MFYHFSLHGFARLSGLKVLWSALIVALNSAALVLLFDLELAAMLQTAL
jgi:hypothetical protein